MRETAQTYIKAIKQGYGKGLADVEWNSPDFKTLEKLVENVFKFSASKNYNTLRDMSLLLKDGDGIRSFDDFRKEVDKLNIKYNHNWLRTEYNQAVASSQCAARWTDYGKRAESNPYLQYQAVMDANTRAEHAALHGVIKRYDDDFWDEYYPPNGWGCRCEVIQLPGKNYKETPKEDMKFCKVDDAFKVNVGKTGKIFSEKHPYFMQRCVSCRTQLGSPDPNNPQCKACTYGMEQCRTFVEECKVKAEAKQKKASMIKQELKGANNWNVTVKTNKDISQPLMDFIKKIDYANFENKILDTLKSLNINDTQQFSLQISSKKIALIVNEGPVKLLIHYINNEGSIVNKLDSIRVDKKYQGKGIGTTITNYLIASAKVLGASKIYFLADKAGGYAWASLANAKNRSCIMNISDKRAMNKIKQYYEDEQHNDNEPFPMERLLNEEWSKEVLLKSSWFAEIIF